MHRGLSCGNLGKDNVAVQSKLRAMAKFTHAAG